MPKNKGKVRKHSDSATSSYPITASPITEIMIDLAIYREERIAVAERTKMTTRNVN
jgi:hypothetical protein